MCAKILENGESVREETKQNQNDETTTGVLDAHLLF
jgi:hypothetical protein